MLTRPLHSVLWNLFLALVPVFLAFLIARGIDQDRKTGGIRWYLWLPVLLVWLAFLPNTCYLVTEWRHYLEQIVTNPELLTAIRHSPNRLFDFLYMSSFYLAYSGCGILTFFLAIYPLDQIGKTPVILKPLFFFLISLGVYLGLIDRFNSWQVVHHLSMIVDGITTAVSKPHTFLTIAGFSLVLWALYEAFCLTADGVAYRQKRSKA